MDENNLLTLEVIHGDITKENTEAIVNSAKLKGDGKLNGLINKAAGKQLNDECLRLCKAENQYALCGIGQARMTSGYDLPAMYVIHTIGPKYDHANHASNEIQLRSCYFSCLTFAFLQGLNSISFPCISTGSGGYPSKAAAKLALFSIDWFLKNHDTPIKLIRFVCHKDADYLAYMQASKELDLRVEFP